MNRVRDDEDNLIQIRQLEARERTPSVSGQESLAPQAISWEDRWVR